MNRGFSLVELLIVMALVAVAGLASTTIGRATAVRAGRADSDGRRATAVVQAMSRIRTGVAPDSGTIAVVVRGLTYDVGFVRRDSLLPAGFELTIPAGAGRPALVLDVPRLAP